MKKRILLVSLFVAIVSLTYGAVPSVDVMVVSPAGKQVYKGKTSANGTFATGKLPAGQYDVQFKSASPLPGDGYVLGLSAGKKKVGADSLAGSKFAAGGFLMKIDVGDGLNITGQLANGGAAGSNPNVKIVNGKKLYWVKSDTGSNIGGRWMTAEEAKAAGYNIGTFSKDTIQQMQDKGHQPGGN